MYYKLSPLILTPGQNSNFISEVYVTQPDSRKEAVAGRAFIVIEIESRKAEDLKIVNFIIESFCNNYYENDKILLREKTKAIFIEHIFESALANTNKKLLEFLHQEKIKFNPEFISATIGVIFENDIHFANIGKNKALLIYKDKKEDVYKIANVTDHTTSGGEKRQHINVAKLFSSVVSGKIPKNGYFIFSNEALPEYISNSQLIKVITTLPPISATEQMKKTLSNINNYIPFLGLIIKNTYGTSKEEQSIQSYSELNHNKLDYKQNSHISNIEESTEEILTTKGTINFKKYLNIIINWIISAKDYLLHKKPNNLKIFHLKDKIFFKKRAANFSLNKTSAILKDIASLIIQSLKYIAQLLKKPFSKAKQEDYSSLTSKIKISALRNSSKLSNPREAISMLTNKVVSSSTKSKVFGLSIGVCVLLLMLNIDRVEENNQAIAVIDNSVEILQKISQKQNQIEANLLYNNENNAKNILAEITALIGELSIDTQEENDKYASILETHNKQLDKIRHAKDIDTAKEISNFSEINKEADPINIIMSNNVIFANDSKQKTIYTLDLKNNLKTAIIDIKEPIDNLKYPILNTNNNDLYYLNDKKSIIKFSTKDNEISKLSINLENVNYDSIKGGAGFGSYIYYVSRADNQIFKFSPKNGGFSSGQKWIKDEKVDVSNAIDMEIDGHIYVLKANGEILKLLKGKAEDFTLDIVEPELKMATKFYISKELNYVYILDPLQKRVVVFNKKGEFIAQYTSNNFSNLKDFIVDEQNNILYLLDTSSVYKISATHL
ncbi:hypothetical protein ISS03_02125 [Patescibacteria group bacterium]|nr:hypothetical protein [Patescibacteria group bacterium]